MRVVNIKVHKKVYLRNVESLVDRSEPRNLIIGFAQALESVNQPLNIQAKKTIKKPIKAAASDDLIEMLLYFENSNKCAYVKNMLDSSKQTLRQRQIKTAKNFFEKTIEDIQDAKFFTSQSDQSTEENKKEGNNVI